MIRTISGFIFLATVASILSLGLTWVAHMQTVFAADGGETTLCANGQPANADGSCPSGGNNAGSGGVNPGPGGGSIKLVNPLASDSFTGETGLFQKIFDVILIFAVPIIIFFIIYAGFLYVTARGDSGQISTAHTALTWAIIGGVIVLGAKVISEVLTATIAAF